MKTNINRFILGLAITSIITTSANAQILTFIWVQAYSDDGGGNSSGVLTYDTVTKTIDSFSFHADDWSTSDNSWINGQTGGINNQTGPVLLSDGNLALNGFSTGGGEASETTSWFQANPAPGTGETGANYPTAGDPGLYADFLGDWVPVPEPRTYEIFAGLGLLRLFVRRHLTTS
jgi:hypothetical protein